MEKEENTEETVENDSKIKEPTEIKARKLELLHFFLKDKYAVALFLILTLALAIRIYYFVITNNQPVWWDEADYLTLAKNFVFNTPEMYNPARQIGIVFVLTALYKVGLGVASFKFLQILLSLASIFLVYLVGKDMFNKKIALIAAFFFSVFWVDLFVVTRVFPDSVGFFGTTLFIYLFWKGFIKKDSRLAAWLVGPAFIIAFMSREANLLLAPVVFIYLLITEKFKLFKNKDAWISVCLGLIASIPYFLFYQLRYGNAILQIALRQSQTVDKFAKIAAGKFTILHGHFVFFQQAPDYLRGGLIILFFIGAYIFIDLLLGADLVFKQKEKSLNKYLFLFIWIIAFYAFFSYYQVYDERYLVPVYPAIFLVAANGLYFVYSEIRKRIDWRVALVVLFAILFIVANSQLTRADNLIKIKAGGQWQVQDAGLWLKEHTAPGDFVVTQSRTQILYYAEREVIEFYFEDEAAFIRELEAKKPKYLMLSAFESHTTPDWAYMFPIKYNITPIKSFYETRSGAGNIVVMLYPLYVQQ